MFLFDLLIKTIYPEWQGHTYMYLSDRSVMSKYKDNKAAIWSPNDSLHCTFATWVMKKNTDSDQNSN